MLASALTWSLAGLVTVAGSALGAGMRTHPLTDSGLGRPFALDQQGRRIALIGGRGASPARLPDGVAPTYLAYRLGDRSQAPADAPSVSVAPGRRGPVIGPLRLDALAKESLDAELAKTGQVAVLTPRQAFLVESWGSSVLSDVAGESKTWRVGAEAPPRGPRAGGQDHSVEGTIKGWYNDSADAIKNWNQQALDALKKMFNADPPKPVIIPPKTAAAQMLVPPEPAAQEMIAPAPAPVPEPGSLIVFAAAATAAVWRFRLGRRRTPLGDRS